MGLDTSYNNISEVLSLLKKCKQRMIGHNGDNYTNKLYNIIYLDDNNKYKYIYNTCALSKHMGNMCMRLRNAGKGEASPRLFPRFAPNTHIYLYVLTVHMYCILSCNDSIYRPI